MSGIYELSSIFLVPHWKYHYKVLFDGALPVFVAVTISSAATSFIHSLVNSTKHQDDITLIIILNFLYSLFFGFFLGIYIMVNQSKWKILSKYSDYIHRVAIENASFAWWSTVSLIILKRIYADNRNHFGEAFAAWIITIIIILSIIYATNLLRHMAHRDNVDINVIENVIEFDSESFSLAIAFGLTIIIAAGIISNESTNYLSGIDDISSVNDDRLTNTAVDIPYIVYVIGITILITAIEYYNIPIFSFMRDSVEVIAFNPILEEESNRPSEEMSSGNLLPLPPHQHQQNSNDKSNNNNLSKDMSHISIDQRNSVTTSSSCITRTDRFFFGWDKNNLTKRTFHKLFTVFRAYLVGCAWYSWSILSFQNYFAFIRGGTLIGLFLYATIVTYINLWLLSRWSNNAIAMKANKQQSNKNKKSTNMNTLTIDPSKNDSDNNSDKDNIILEGNRESNTTFDDSNPPEKADLLLMSGRLIVGWAWQQFITSCVVESVPKSRDDRLWLVTIVKSIIALIVTIAGGYFDQNWRIHRQTIRESIGSILIRFRSSRSISRLSMGLKSHDEEENGEKNKSMDNNLNSSSDSGDPSDPSDLNESNNHKNNSHDYMNVSNSDGIRAPLLG